MKMSEYVTTKECEQHRAVLAETDAKQCTEIVELKANSKFLVKGFWIMFTAVCTGFVGTIFTMFITR